MRLRIQLPGFSYAFYTDRYLDEMEARGHIRETIAPKNPDAMMDYMHGLKIQPVYNGVDNQTTSE